MKGLFYGSFFLSVLPDISNWNIKNVEDLSYMFDGCKSLKVLPHISIWNTFNVKDMSYMFHNCWYLTSFPDISYWYTYNVKNMSHMFHNCFSLLSFPKLNWNISNVQDMSFMFHNFPLHLIKFEWNISNNQNTFHMFTNFENYSSCNEIINISFKLTNGIQGTVVVYNDVLVEDSIDKFLWNNKILNYNSDELKLIYNIKELNKNKTLLENGVNNCSNIIEVIIPRDLKGAHNFVI